MSDQQAFIEAFLERIKSHYLDDVLGVIVYGSYVTGDRHALSDLDLVVIGKNDRVFELSTQFIYQDIGYDFFCMKEDRLKAIIFEFQPLISIIAEGTLVYANNLQTAQWFASQKEDVLTKAQFTSYSHFADKIEHILVTMKALAFDHRFASKPQKIQLQGQLIYLIGHFLGLLNRRHFKYGIKHFVQEIAAFELKPKTILYYLELFLHQTVNSDDVMKFVGEVDDYWRDLKQQGQTPLKTSDYIGFYEEALSSWQKLYHATDNNDLFTAFLAATSLENELTNFRNHGATLESMFINYHGNVESLAIDAHSAQNSLLKVLQTHEVSIIRLDTLEAVIKLLKGEK